MGVGFAILWILSSVVFVVADSGGRQISFVAFVLVGAIAAFVAGRTISGLATDAMRLAGKGSSPIRLLIRLLANVLLPAAFLVGVAVCAYMSFYGPKVDELPYLAAVALFLASGYFMIGITSGVGSFVGRAFPQGGRLLWLSYHSGHLASFLILAGFTALVVELAFLATQPAWFFATAGIISTLGWLMIGAVFLSKLDRSRSLQYITAQATPSNDARRAREITAKILAWDGADTQATEEDFVGGILMTAGLEDPSELDVAVSAFPNRITRKVIVPLYEHGGLLARLNARELRVPDSVATSFTRVSMVALAALQDVGTPGGAAAAIRYQRSFGEYEFDQTYQATRADIETVRAQDPSYVFGTLAIAIYVRSLLGDKNAEKYLQPDAVQPASAQAQEIFDEGVSELGLA